MKINPFLLISTTALLLSCSVKEDRKECPCILEIKTSVTPETGVVDIAGFDGNNQIVFDRFDRESCPKRYEREVRRCMLSLVGVLSDKEYEYSDGGRIISIDNGLQADSLFAGVTRVDASGETASSTVSLHKQFSTVHIFHEQEREVSCDYSMEVRGDCAGFDVLSLEPVEGDFHYETSFPAEGTAFRIWRMTEDSSLWITIFETENHEVVKSFLLSRMMKDAGYDCVAQDLQDVDIYVNLISMNLSISITEWSGTVMEVDI